jgi:hypothetical protein
MNERRQACRESIPIVSSPSSTHVFFIVLKGIEEFALPTTQSNGKCPLENVGNYAEKNGVRH